MQIAMWVAAGLGAICLLLVVRRRFFCRGCRGDGFISEVLAPSRAGVTTELPVYEDQACPLCNGGKWMKYKRCTRCIGRGRIHRGNKTALCPVCKGSGRIKLSAGVWIGAFFLSVFDVILMIASGCILGVLLWGIWSFLQQFAIEAGSIG